MTDIAREIRQALLRHEPEVASFVGLDVPGIVRRTRTRQVLYAIGVIVAASLVMLGVTSGLSAVLRADADRPADPPSPPVLVPPAEAPVALGTGEANGWTWMLSASADGACVALTDAQGSEVVCDGAEAGQETGGTGAVRNDIVTATIRSPQQPAPPLTIIFGRVPARSATVQLRSGPLTPSDAQLFQDPLGVDGPAGFYVGWISGYGYPVMPEVTVWVRDEQDRLLDNLGEVSPQGVTLELPSWAEPATRTVLASLASGTKLMPVGDGFGFVDWELAIFRDEATGKVCFGELAEAGDDAYVCGPVQDPGPAWVDAILAWCGPPSEVCGWPLTSFGGMGGAGPDGIGSFGWGIARAPVVAVRAERYVLPNGSSGSSERAGWLDAELIDLPAEFGGLFQVWVYSCDDCLTGKLVGLDAAGDAIVTP